MEPLLRPLLNKPAEFDQARTEWAKKTEGLLTELEQALATFFDKGQIEWDKSRSEQFENDPRPVKPVTDYGSSNPEEAFAEAFMSYVIERNMDRDQIDSFKAVLKTGAEERVASRYEHRVAVRVARAHQLRRAFKIKEYPLAGEKVDGRTAA